MSKILRQIWPFLLLSSIFYSIYYSYILKIPPVWPDDALIADVSLNLLKTHTFGTSLLKETLPGAEFIGFGYPPLFFYILAGWFKLVNFSIINQRVLSLIIGILFAFLYTLLLKAFIKSKNEINDNKLAVVGLALIFLDSSFQKATIISRPEILVLFLGFLSIFVYLKNYKYSYLFSGFFLGLAVMSHFLSLIFFFSYVVLFIYKLLRIEGPKFSVTKAFKRFAGNEPQNLETLLHLHPRAIHPISFRNCKSTGFWRSGYKFKLKVFSVRQVYAFLAGLLMPIICWIILVYQYLPYLINILSLRLQYKTTAPRWVMMVFSGESLELKIVYIFYIVVGVLLFAKVLRSPTSKNILIFSLLFFSWVFSYIWQTEYSFVYVPVFSLFALAYILFDQIHNYSIKKLIRFNNLITLNFILFSVILLLNTYQFVSKMINLGGDNFSYSQFAKSIDELIPEDTTVYMSSIPDPYYALINKKNVTLYHFPALPTSKESLISILNKSDYVIFNSPLEISSMGEVISIPYIQKNAETIWPIGSYDQYSAFLVKLVVKDKRMGY